MVDNKIVIFKKVPDGLPVPGEHIVVETRAFNLDSVPSGGLIVEVLTVSLDPYLRYRMRHPDAPSTFTPPFLLDGPLENVAVARVLKSDNESYSKGEVIYALLPFAQYAAIPAEKLPGVTKIDNPHGLSLDLFVGPLGMAGLTAYSSLHKIGRPQKGETIFVSSAAGAVGQVVGQIAKREGLTVIGSVGSDEKLDFILNALGFDGGFNYKKEKPLDALRRLTPQGLDIYYENVGGEHLEAAVEHMNLFGRIIVSGMIGGYNQPMEQRYGVRNLVEFFPKRLTMTGFLVGDKDFGPAYTKEHQKTVQSWIADGSFPAKLHITRGLENAPEAFVELFTGKNFGKAVLRVQD